MISKLAKLVIAAALMTSLSGCIVVLDGEDGSFHHHKIDGDHQHHDEKPAEEVEKTAT